MSISQPSQVIYTIDVPEVTDLQAVFQYNFFVPDESVNDSGGIPAWALSRPSSEVNAQFIQYSVTRVPRYVKMNWTPPKLADVGNLVGEQSQRNTSFKTTGAQYGSLILDNISTIVNEDNFSSNTFSSVHFHDGEIDDKIHALISGTYIQQTLEESTSTDNSPHKASQRLLTALPSSISPHFIVKGLTNLLGTNTTHNSVQKVSDVNSANVTLKQGLLDSRYSFPIVDKFYARLKNVTTNTQINTKLMHDLVNRSINDPTSTTAGDMVNLHQYSKQVQKTSNARFSTAIAENDFKTFASFIEVKRTPTSSHTQKYGAELVGFIIDKFEVLANGKTNAYPPIVIESPTIGLTADFQVKFNANYCYTIRSIALFTVPAIDDDTGEVATIKMLISSKPSNKIYVSTLKLDNPPPPGDVNFIWNYQTAQLMMTWAFPVTSEQDIKQFQVFSRSSTAECFQLQKVYNFDDSVVPFPSSETPDASLVEHITSPTCYWIDGSFDPTVNTKQASGIIYAVCAIDAHGQTSNYSAQFVVWFDPFQNKIQKALVSHLGAPKPYPNLYLEGQLFVDTIASSGKSQMRLYFNPQYYYTSDDQNSLTQVVQTNQVNGFYKLNIINLDNLLATEIDITVDDRTTQSPQGKPVSPRQFGPARNIFQARALLR